jgi:hypothetical protein
MIGAIKFYDPRRGYGFVNVSVPQAPPPPPDGEVAPSTHLTTVFFHRNAVVITGDGATDTGILLNRGDAVRVWVLPDDSTDGSKGRARPEAVRIELLSDLDPSRQSGDTGGTGCGGDSDRSGNVHSVIVQERAQLERENGDIRLACHLAKTAADSLNTLAVSAATGACAEGDEAVRADRIASAVNDLVHAARSVPSSRLLVRGGVFDGLRAAHEIGRSRIADVGTRTELLKLYRAALRAMPRWAFSRRQRQSIREMLRVTRDAGDDDGNEDGDDSDEDSDEDDADRGESGATVAVARQVALQTRPTEQTGIRSNGGGPGDADDGADAKEDCNGQSAAGRSCTDGSDIGSGSGDRGDTGQREGIVAHETDRRTERMHEQIERALAQRISGTRLILVLDGLTDAANRYGILRTAEASS